jgi:hypothetical protein
MVSLWGSSDPEKLIRQWIEGNAIQQPQILTA